MSKQANPKVIGGFVLGALALIVIVFVIFGSAEFFKKTNSFVIYFEGDVTGLRIGSPVKVRGVDIGSVTKITPLYDKEGDILIEVIVKIYAGMIQDTLGYYEGLKGEQFMENVVNRGLRARLESQSILTGVKYIKFDFFPDSPLNLKGLNKSYFEVPSIRTTQEEIQIVLRETLDKLRELDFDKISDKMAEAAGNLSSTLNGIDDLVNSPELKETFTSISKNMKAIESLVSDLDEQLDPLLEDKLDVLLSDLADSSKALTRALERGEKVLAQMETVAVDEQYEVHIALNEIAKSSRAMRLLLDQIQREPRSLIFGKK